jgi:hypothetical protein
MGHGNLSDRPEWIAFAASVMKDGKLWIREKSTIVEDGKIESVFETKTPLDSAVPEGTTPCYLNVKAGPVLTYSDYIE